MKICITAKEKGSDSEVDPLFGRCQYFFLINSVTGEVDILENPNKEGSGGVGIRAAQLMAEKNVETVLTGNVGPNAFRTLKAADIDVVTGVTGTINEVLGKYKNKEYNSTDGPSVESHSGINR